MRNDIIINVHVGVGVGKGGRVTALVEAVVTRYRPMVVSDVWWRLSWQLLESPRPLREKHTEMRLGLRAGRGQRDYARHAQPSPGSIAAPGTRTTRHLLPPQSQRPRPAPPRFSRKGTLP